jgi:protocadherin Fat 1/2/3
LAFDKDEGENGRIKYSIKSGKGKNKFRIHPENGIVYAAKRLDNDLVYDLTIKAEDNGNPKKVKTTSVRIQTVKIDGDSPNPPKIISTDQIVDVAESDSPEILIADIQAVDDDNDQLWYEIIDGDVNSDFYISESGKILLAKNLDYDVRKEYNLTIGVTDGNHIVKTHLYVSVIDSNNHRPEFTKHEYRVEISENTERDAEILQLHATDADDDKKLFYSLHAAKNPTSLELFRVDSMTGVVTLLQKLDRELIAEHLLIVSVKDQGTPAKRNFAKVVIRVHDFNNHIPEFTSKLIEGKVFEASAIGTQVVQLYAIDRDAGENAKISYSIVSGNIGNAFSIDEHMGSLSVAKELDIQAMQEYVLQVKASDAGKPPLSSQIPVHIMVQMADNAPPRFIHDKIHDGAAEIYENLPIGSFVKHLEVKSVSSVLFEIVNGNKNDIFTINPSTGIITTKDEVDYESINFFNLTIRATNMAAKEATCNLIIQILDRNDNHPYFENALYRGIISESAEIGSLVSSLDYSSTNLNETIPLVIKARDNDSGQNSLLHFDIVEYLPRKYFHIDSSSGAIKNVIKLDYEKIPFYSFTVKVSDLGRPRLSSLTMARVEIKIINVNDCTPKFEKKEYNATLLLPTYENVAVIRVNATDKDMLDDPSAAAQTLRYDIIDGDGDKVFNISPTDGTIVTTRHIDKIKSYYKLHVRVSDGKYSSIAYVYVNVVNSENSGLVFHKSIYENSVAENSTKIQMVCIVNVLGADLNEHIEFRILNPTDMFRIGPTSGAIETTGKRFDREEKDNYELIIEAKSQTRDRTQPRVAHVVVRISISDENDNCPMFVNLPYYTLVSVDEPKGAVILKVQAIDLDAYENGEVRYEMKKGHGELFRVDRKTGEISLKQSLEGHNKEYQLLISAFDGGIIPCSTDVIVNVKVSQYLIRRFLKIFTFNSAQLTTRHQKIYKII